MAQKQSNGYLNVQLVGLQFMFLALYILVVVLSLEGGNSLNIAGVKIGEFDIAFILAGIVTQFVFSMYLFIRWNRTSYRIENNHLIVTSGFMTTESRSINLNDLIAPYARQSLLGKYFGYGTVELAIRFSDSPMYLQGVHNPNGFVKTIRQRANANSTLA